MPDDPITRHSHLEMRPIKHQHKERLLQIAARIWDGHDYLPMVFDRWVEDTDSRFLGLFEDERLVGCGRMMQFDERRVWMEALRVDPADQGKGWGREITRRMIRLAVETGYEELYFSTYFRNSASIRITEQFGFRIIAKYSYLEMDLEKSPPSVSSDENVQAGSSRNIAVGNAAKSSPDEGVGADESYPDQRTSAGHGRLEIRPGIPDVDDYLWNDWLFVPADAPHRERYFPSAETVRFRDCTILLCENTKYTPGTLDIGWVSGSDPESLKPCMEYAGRRARKEDRRKLQLMLPETLQIAPFRELGFRSFEQELDVFLFRAMAGGLRL